MSTTEAAAAGMASGGDGRLRELQEFDDTKTGVKGLVDSGITSIPAIFHHPPDSLLLEVTKTMPTSMAIPVIDLSSARPEEVIDQVREAAETVGFFQVVNHGVPGELLASMLAAVKRFNEQPVEAKRPYYTRDPSRKIKFNSNFDLFQSSAANWRDSITCLMAPEPPQLEELPEAIRGVMLEYGDAVMKLALRMFELLSRSLGLDSDHLKDMGSTESLVVVSHYYPPCPEPHLTLGTSKHTDPAFLTVLLQDAMCGLQVLTEQDGNVQGWTDVPPLPGALIINIGDMLQLVSNGRFRSVEHRVLANQSKDTPRISVASFFSAEYMKTPTRLYGPIPELTSSEGCNPPLYRSVTAREFIAHFRNKGLDSRHRLDYFKLEQDTPTPV
ncbi:hypothetical protein ACP4OV_017540 [Aristida adscensionis]